VLFFTFLTGTAGYFDTEIDRWMRPELPVATQAVPGAQALEVALARLRSRAPGAERWFVTLPADRNEPWLRIFWQYPRRADGSRAAPNGSEQLDMASGAPLQARATGGGQLLYRMHWRLHYLPFAVAVWLVGIATMFMLVAIMTGVIVHKRILADFFTFRPGKGQRSWLDAHNLLAVLALPFHLMITYSGLLFFAYLYMAPVIAAAYGPGEAGRKAFFDELLGEAAPVQRAGVAAPLTPLAPLLDQAEARWGKGRVGYLDIRHPGDANARVVVRQLDDGRLRAGREMEFDGASGALVAARQATRSAPQAVRDVLLGLHEGLFAGWALRWLYFLSGLMGTAMVGAGLVLWTVKRQARIGETLGFRLVERLNVGVIVGLPAAVAAYFWSNRLIPVGIEGRPAWEAHAMFIAWAVMLLHAFVRPRGRAWAEQLWIAAAAFGLLPLLNALTTARHLGVTLPAGIWGLAGFDLAMLALGVAFGAVAWTRTRGRPRPIGPAVPAKAAD
jgi:uncharacterized iron-regulated membrane protein